MLYLGIGSESLRVTLTLFLLINTRGEHEANARVSVHPQHSILSYSSRSTDRRFGESGMII